MDTKEVGEKVVELVHKQAWHEAIDTLYGDDVVSVESQGREGESPEKHGIEAVRAKADWWVANMEVHKFKATGPFVAHDRFVVVYDVDFSEKGKPDRIQMSEAGVYTVMAGKIVREEFLPLAEEKDEG